MGVLHMYDYKTRNSIARISSPNQRWVHEGALFKMGLERRSRLGRNSFGQSEEWNGPTCREKGSAAGYIYLYIGNITHSGTCRPSLTANVD
jgi:hypothetical protein